MYTGNREMQTDGIAKQLEVLQKRVLHLEVQLGQGPKDTYLVNGMLYTTGDRVNYRVTKTWLDGEFYDAFQKHAFQKHGADSAQVTYKNESGKICYIRVTKTNIRKAWIRPTDTYLFDGVMYTRGDPIKFKEGATWRDGEFYDVLGSNVEEGERAQVRYINMNGVSYCTTVVAGNIRKAEPSVETETVRALQEGLITQDKIADSVEIDERRHTYTIGGSRYVRGDRVKFLENGVWELGGFYDVQENPTCGDKVRVIQKIGVGGSLRYVTVEKWEVTKVGSSDKVADNDEGVNCEREDDTPRRPRQSGFEPGEPKKGEVYFYIAGSSMNSREFERVLIDRVEPCDPDVGSARYLSRDMDYQVYYLVNIDIDSGIQVSSRKEFHANYTFHSDHRWMDTFQNKKADRISN